MDAISCHLSADKLIRRSHVPAFKGLSFAVVQTGSTRTVQSPHEVG